MRKVIYLSLLVGFTMTASSQAPSGLEIGTTGAVTFPFYSQLTFTVNMKPQIDQGNFNPYVDVAGVMINEETETVGPRVKVVVAPAESKLGWNIFQ